MYKILVNDGMHSTGQKMLEDAKCKVETTKVDQKDLPKELPNYDVIIVRSATKVRKDLIDSCPNLKIIARGGVGLDNIDVDYAKSKGIKVMNTPAASSLAVAELAFGHMFGLARSLYKANREMPSTGSTDFKALKKSYSKGVQLRGKTLGIIGLGRIGQETARIGFSLGMKILGVDPFHKQLEMKVNDGYNVSITTVDMETMLQNSDFITLHIPNTGKPVLTKQHFDMMKNGAFLVNASRGGTVDEDAMLEALNSGKLAGAGVDVFENEPNPRADILNHPNVSLSPHIGASTQEAQANIGIELAEQILAFKD